MAKRIPPTVSKSKKLENICHANTLEEVLWSDTRDTFFFEQEF